MGYSWRQFHNDGAMYWMPVNEGAYSFASFWSVRRKPRAIATWLAESPLLFGTKVKVEFQTEAAAKTFVKIEASNNLI